MRLIFLGAFLSCLLLSSCKNGVHLTSVINLDAPVSLATLKSEEIIHINSTKWIGLVEFAANNKKGWVPTSSLFVGTEILIKQNDFSFRYYPSAEIATIKFENEEGKEFKYSKNIGRDQLDFLLN